MIKFFGAPISDADAKTIADLDPKANYGGERPDLRSSLYPAAPSGASELRNQRDTSKYMTLVGFWISEF